MVNPWCQILRKTDSAHKINVSPNLKVWGFSLCHPKWLRREKIGQADDPRKAVGMESGLELGRKWVRNKHVFGVVWCVSQNKT